MSASITLATLLAQVQALEAAAASPVAAPASPTAGTPDWLVARGARKADRRALAATLRAQGVNLSTDAGKAAWAKAKKAAGITAAEIAAHKAFVAKA